MPRPPTHEIRYGLILARIWRQPRKTQTRYVVTVTRLFRNGSDWKQSSRFGPDDLPTIRFALDKAHNWILKHAER
jgi:hypothetical protein